ncbi:Nif3-like dinuclear metal center hexameric protein [bacterium]|nr:Nif3-like dinuclear metal center hexameric protein [bacterium]
MKKLDEIVEYLDELLDIHSIKDRSQNGLQVENKGKINKIGLAVDACVATFEAAAEQKIDFILVHHGLFWNQPENITGPLYQRLKYLIDHDIAIYAAHLPLDLHADHGNNIQIVKLMEWNDAGAFGDYNGVDIGRASTFSTPLNRDKIKDDLARKLQCEPVIWPFGKEKCQRIAIVSGGGLGLMKEAAQDGFDMLITGEPAHSSYWPAKELNLNLIFCGHYATETLGVKAVGEMLREKTGLDVVFLDLPTGY